MSKERLLDPGGTREILVRQKTKEFLDDFIKNISKISPKSSPSQEKTPPGPQNNDPVAPPKNP